MDSKLHLDVYIRKSRLLNEGYVPFSAATLWRRVKDGSFPQPVQLSSGVVAWRMSDVQAWQRRNYTEGRAS